MKKHTICLLGIVLVAMNGAYGAPNNSGNLQTPPQGQMPSLHGQQQGALGGNPGQGDMGRNPRVDVALHACAANVPKDQWGGPDRRAMEACMREKGFTPPPHHGQGGEQGGTQGPGAGQLGQQGPGGFQQGGAQQPPMGAPGAGGPRRGN